MSELNLQTVKNIYSSFWSGNVPGMVDQCAEDIKWGFEAHNSDVPWHAPVYGKAGLPEFFRIFKENTEVHVFEPRAFVHSGDYVGTYIHIELTVRKTGKRVNMDQFHWFQLNDQNKVVLFWHFEDTAQVINAYHGTP